LTPVVVAREAVGVVLRAATTDLSETMVTTETAVAGSTAEEVMAAMVAVEMVAEAEIRDG